MSEASEVMVFEKMTSQAPLWLFLCHRLIYNLNSLLKQCLSKAMWKRNLFLNSNILVYLNFLRLHLDTTHCLCYICPPYPGIARIYFVVYPDSLLNREIKPKSLLLENSFIIFHMLCLTFFSSSKKEMCLSLFYTALYYSTICLIYLIVISILLSPGNIHVPQKC